MKKHYYKVYGLKIISEIEVPEFIKSDDFNKENCDVEISFGKDSFYVDSGLEHYYKKNDMLFTIKDVARYHIIDGNRILVDKFHESDEIKVKTYLLGSAFGMLLMQRGIVAIHGGCVSKDNKPLIIVGESGAGKSTMVNKLIRDGYKFIADDISAINVEKGIVIEPSFPQQKLCEDIIENNNLDSNKYKKVVDGRNKYLVPVDKDIFLNTENEVSNLVEIVVDDVDNVSIEKLQGASCLKSIINNIYRAWVFEFTGMSREYFMKCMKISSKVNYYKITRPKKYDTTQEVYNLIKSVC